jgi:SAM-dependent methyltransferase
VTISPASKIDRAASGETGVSRGGAASAAGADTHANVITPRWVRTRFRIKPLRLADSTHVHDSCPVCKSVPFVPITALSTRRGERVVERALCAACGHVAFSRMPSIDWFTALYRHEFETVEPAPLSPPIKEPIAILDVLLPRMAAGPQRILDIGCGYGSALQSFRALGHSELYGLEPSDRRAKVASGAGFRVAHRPAESLLDDPILQQGVPFDVIYSWHAFEHIFDVREAMAQAVRALRPGGLLFICVPHQEAEHFVQMAHYLPHIHSFSNDSLRALMEGEGLEVVYEDTSLRMIGRKPEAHAGKAPAVGRVTDQRERLRQKFIRDFGLRKLPELGTADACFQYSDYHGSREVLEPSFGKFRRLDAMLPRQLTSRLLTALGRARGGAESLPLRLGTKWIGLTARHSGPLVIGPANVRLPPRGALPTLHFVYDEDEVRAWYK